MTDHAETERLWSMVINSPLNVEMTLASETGLDGLRAELARKDEALRAIAELVAAWKQVSMFPICVRELESILTEEESVSD